MTQGIAAAVMAKVGKLKIADHARLMGDNQKTLDRANAQDGRARDRHERIEDAVAKATHGTALADPSRTAKDDDSMQIFIDSPVTIEGGKEETRPPFTQPPTSGLKKAALAAALLGAGGGLGAAVPLVLDAMKPTVPVVTPADSDTQYELRIGGE